MNMKKILLTLAFVLPLTLAVQGAKTPAAPVDSTDEVEVFSDTTSVDSVQVPAADPWDDIDDEWDDWEKADAHSIISELGINGNDLLGIFGPMLTVVAVLFILFVLAPVALIGIILYFVYKNRKERMRLMETALKNGKQIPLDVMGTPYMRNDQLWNKGIKQMFLGAGLAFLLWIVIGKLGLAIGALIALIGCGNLVIAHNYKKKEQDRIIKEQMGFYRRTDKGSEDRITEEQTGF